MESENAPVVRGSTIIDMKSLFKYFRVTFFFILLLLYTLYDYMNSSNAGFDDSNRGGVYLFLLLIVGYCILYLFFRIPKDFLSPAFTKAMVALVIWILLCNIMTERMGWVMGVHLFMSIWWICTYYFFYVYCSTNPGSSDYIIAIFSLMLILYLYFSVTSQTRIQLNRDTDHAVLNYAYNILAFVPIVLLIKNKVIRYVLLLLAIGALFFSFKRGPLVILPAMCVFYQLGQSNSKKGTVSRIINLIVILVLFLAVFAIADKASGGFLSSRFSRSELQYGSTRNELWATAIADIRSRDFFTLLIGKGSGSSIELLTSGVHNEWLEFLFSFGIIGVILYFIFGVSLLGKFNKMRKNYSTYAPIMGILTAFFWMVGLFSGFYFVHASFYFFAMLGMIDAFEKNRLYERRQSD